MTLSKFVQWAEHLIATEPAPPQTKADAPRCTNCSIPFQFCACEDCIGAFSETSYCHLCREMYRAAVKQPGLQTAHETWKRNQSTRRDKLGL